MASSGLIPAAPLFLMLEALELYTLLLSIHPAFFLRQYCSTAILKVLLTGHETCLCFAASRGSEELSSLAFLDCNLLLLCCATGRLCLADTRQPQGLVEAVPAPSAPCGEHWCMGTRHAAQGSEPSSQPVARLSSRGLLALTDLRKTSEFLALAKARVPSPGSGAEFLCVSWAPALEGYLAISGRCLGQRSPFLGALLIYIFVKDSSLHLKPPSDMVAFQCCPWSQQRCQLIVLCSCLFPTTREGGWLGSGRCLLPFCEIKGPKLTTSTA